MQTSCVKHFPVEVILLYAFILFVFKGTEVVWLWWTPTCEAHHRVGAQNQRLVSLCVCVFL